MNLLSRIFAVSILLITSACGIYENKTPPPSVDASAIVANPSAQISFAQVSQSIFLPSCVSCHNQSTANGGVALDSYSKVSAHISAVKYDIDNHIMPAVGSLSSDQILLFDRWYAQGSPETADGSNHSPSPTPSQTATPTPTDTPVLTPVTYAQINQSIFQASCLSCHNATHASGGVVLDTYPNVMKRIADVIQDIDSGDMPMNGSLTASQKQLFDAWVQQGEPEGSPLPSPTATPSATPPPSPTPDLNAQAIALVRNNFNLYVYPLVNKACMDCHDSHAKPEGIGVLPIINGVEWKHIQEGSKALDFSRTFPNWSDYSSDPLFYLSQLKGVLVNNTMPLPVYIPFHEFDGKLLRSDEKQIILNWIEDSKQILSSATVTPPSPRDYLNNHCMGCHNSSISSGGFILGSGKSVNGIPEVSPFHPENSVVYLVLLNDSTARHGLPQMPYGDQATADDQKLIYNWIVSGAP